MAAGTSITFTTLDEFDVDIRKLALEVTEAPDEFAKWDALVKAVEMIEGGLHRNSSPQAITAYREVYDKLLARFPLFYGYFVSYAKHEFIIAGTEASEMGRPHTLEYFPFPRLINPQIYERGVACVSASSELWNTYCEFKISTSHDPANIRELFERAAEAIGNDYGSWPFWDRYLDYEKSLRGEGADDRVFALLLRVITLVNHHYNKYMDEFRAMAITRPVKELGTKEHVDAIKAQVDQELTDAATAEEKEARVREILMAEHEATYAQVSADVTTRWQFEQLLKRHWFHVHDMEEVELNAWREYLDFEESQGNYSRIVSLYERALVPCAYYIEFWLRYVRWMTEYHPEKIEEIRFIYQRACIAYTAIAEPEMRLLYAVFEEGQKRFGVAEEVYRAILITLPGHLDTINAWASSVLRNNGLEAAMGVYQTQIDTNTCDMATKCALVGEQGRLLWKNKGSVDEARGHFVAHKQHHADSSAFWTSYLNFEIDQPTTAATQAGQHNAIRDIVNEIRFRTQLSAADIKALVDIYMKYLYERGGLNGADEIMLLGATSNRLFREGQRAEQARFLTQQRA